MQKTKGKTLIDHLSWNQQVGVIIRTARIKKNITQEKLSELTFLSIKQISDTENGKRPVSLEEAAKFAKVFGCEIVELVPDLEWEPVS